MICKNDINYKDIINSSYKFKNYHQKTSGRATLNVFDS